MTRYRWTYHPQWGETYIVLCCEKCNSYDMVLTEEPSGRSGGEYDRRIVARCRKCLGKEAYRVALGSVYQVVGQKKAQPGNAKEKDDPELARILNKINPR